MKWIRSSLFQPLLAMIGIAAMMTGGLWLGKTLVPIDKAVSSSAEPETGNLTRVEYVMEKVGSRKVEAEPTLSAPTGANGYWIVEHYRQYEYHYDANHRFLYKNPTQQETYLRYWHAR